MWHIIHIVLHYLLAQDPEPIYKAKHIVLPTPAEAKMDKEVKLSMF